MYPLQRLQEVQVRGHEGDTAIKEREELSLEVVRPHSVAVRKPPPRAPRFGFGGDISLPLRVGGDIQFAEDAPVSLTDIDFSARGLHLEWQSYFFTDRSLLHISA